MAREKGDFEDRRLSAILNNSSNTAYTNPNAKPGQGLLKSGYDTSMFDAKGNLKTATSTQPAATTTSPSTVAINPTNTSGGNTGINPNASTGYSQSVPQNNTTLSDYLTKYNAAAGNTSAQAQIKQDYQNAVLGVNKQTTPTTTTSPTTANTANNVYKAPTYNQFNAPIGTVMRDPQTGNVKVQTSQGVWAEGDQALPYLYQALQQNASLKDILSLSNEDISKLNSSYTQQQQYLKDQLQGMNFNYANAENSSGGVTMRDKQTGQLYNTIDSLANSTNWDPNKYERVNTPSNFVGLYGQTQDQRAMQGGSSATTTQQNTPESIQNAFQNAFNSAATQAEKDNIRRQYQNYILGQQYSLPTMQTGQTGTNQNMQQQPTTQQNNQQQANNTNTINQMYEQQKNSLVAQLKQKIAEGQYGYQDTINKAAQTYQPMRDQAAISNARAGQTLREQLANTGNSASGAGRSELLQSALSGENQINSINQQQQNTVNDAQTAINRLAAQGALQESQIGADMTAQQLQALLSDQYKQQDYGLQLANLLGTYGNQSTLAKQQFDASRASDAFNQQLSLAQLLGTYGNQQTLAAKQADRDYNLNLAGLTGTINGQQTMQAQSQAWQQAFSEKQQKLDEEYRQDQLSQQEYEFETNKLAQQKAQAMQEAGLTGYYNGSQTLDAQQWLTDRTNQQNQYDLDLYQVLQNQANYEREYQSQIQQTQANLEAAKEAAKAKGQQDKYDNAIKLFEALGVANADIAPILGVPVGTKSIKQQQTEYNTNKPYYNPSTKKTGTSSKSSGYQMQW